MILLSIFLRRLGTEFRSMKLKNLNYDLFDFMKTMIKNEYKCFVENKIMVELKAIIQLDDVRLAKAINYLEAYNMEVGLLINFGSKSLQFKRLQHKPRKSNNQ